MRSASKARGRRISRTMICAASPALPTSAEITVMRRQEHWADGEREQKEGGDENGQRERGGRRLPSPRQSTRSCRLRLPLRSDARQRVGAASPLRLLPWPQQGVNDRPGRGNSGRLGRGEMHHSLRSILAGVSALIFGAGAASAPDSAPDPHRLDQSLRRRAAGRARRSGADRSALALRHRRDALLRRRSGKGVSPRCRRQRKRWSTSTLTSSSPAASPSAKRAIC